VEALGQTRTRGAVRPAYENTILRCPFVAESRVDVPRLKVKGLPHCAGSTTEGTGRRAEHAATAPGILIQTPTPLPPRLGRLPAALRPAYATGLVFLPRGVNRPSVHLLRNTPMVEAPSVSAGGIFRSIRPTEVPRRLTDRPRIRMCSVRRTGFAPTAGPTRSAFRHGLERVALSACAATERETLDGGIGVPFPSFASRRWSTRACSRRPAGYVLPGLRARGPGQARSPWCSPDLPQHVPVRPLSPRPFSSRTTARSHGTGNRN